MIPNIVLAIVGVAIAGWLIGFSVYVYHALSYGIPGDKTKLSIFALILIAFLAVLVSTYFMSGIYWEIV